MSHRFTGTDESRPSKATFLPCCDKDNGRTVFAGGPTSALSPEDLKAMLDKMKPLERDAYVKGAREYIAALMGTSRSDAASAWQQFDKSWMCFQTTFIITFN